MAELPENRRFEILIDVLCCVMAADGKASASEKQHIAALMDEAGSQWTTDELGKRISRFVSRVRTMGFPDVLHWTCDDARLLLNTDQGKFLEDHLRIAEAAPEIRPSERKVIDQICESLVPPAIGESSGVDHEQLAQPAQSQQGDLRPARLSPTHKWVRTGVLFLCCVAGTVPSILEFCERPGRLDDSLFGLFGFGVLGLLAGIVVAFLLIMFVELLLGLIIPAISAFYSADSRRGKFSAGRRVAKAAFVGSLPLVLPAVALVVRQQEQHDLLETVAFLPPLGILGLAIAWIMTTETLEMTVLERLDLVRMVMRDDDGNRLPTTESYLTTDRGLAWTCDSRPMDKNQRYRVRGRWSWTSAAMKFVVTSAHPIESTKILDAVPSRPILMISNAKAMRSLTWTKFVILGLAFATTVLVAAFCMTQGCRSEVAWLFVWYFPCFAVLVAPLQLLDVSRQLLSE
jgi:uncharacterized tellurite resistance protein B-like protein